MTGQRGFIALTTVLILSAVLLSVAISMASRGIGQSTSYISMYASMRTHALAELCAEYALLELERTLDYNGGNSIMVGSDSCDVVAVEGTGNTDRTVKTQSTLSGHTHRIVVTVSEISPEMAVSSWESVSAF